MDRLDYVLDVAYPLLDQVDGVLSSAGAPSEHAMWAELRRVRLLPGDAVRAVAALRPAAFADVVGDLRADARTCAELAEFLPFPDEWTGEAADAYDVVRRRAAAHLGGRDESLDEQLEATADLAQALADWMSRARADVAGTLAHVLGSGAAFALTEGGTTVPPPEAEVHAAALIATHVLRTIADSYEYGHELLHGSAALATPNPM